MRQNVYLYGHASMTTRGGFATVPKGCTLKFFSENLKGLTTGFLMTVLMDPENQLKGGEADLEIKEYKSVPDYILTPDNTNRQRALNAFQMGVNDYGPQGQHNILFHPTAPVLLSRILQYFDSRRPQTVTGYDFYWLACRAFFFPGNNSNPNVNVNQANRTLSETELYTILLTTN